MDTKAEINYPKKRTWLKVMRIERELNQTDVAKALGMSQMEYSYIESGRMLPKEKTAKALGAFYGFDWTIFYK